MKSYTDMLEFIQWQQPNSFIFWTVNKNKFPLYFRSEALFLKDPYKIGRKLNVNYALIRR